MPQIQQLPAHIADLIAAGEVVERPASVCKELLENALDAGASAVSVELEKGGLTYLRVTDNGCGMAADQLPTAFLRHATSKLRTASDLAAIHTLGFRGEALAAISAVSRLDVFSREPSSDAGAMLHLEGGVPGEVTAAGCPVGTTVCVRDLFYNTPARMKFMKKDSAEGAAASAVVTQLALSHPNVSFKLLRDGAEVLHTPGNGELLPAVYAALGREFALSLLPVSGSNGEVRVSGFVTKPLAGHGTRARQLFFVNGRLVKSQLLTAAVEEGYRNRLLKGKFPGCVLHITLPADAVDVNVHPAKTVVKFVSDKTVFDAVYHTVTSALDEEGRPPKPAEKPFFQTMTAAEFRARPDAPAPKSAVAVPEGRAVGSAPARTYTPVPAPAPAAPVPEVRDVAPEPGKAFTAPTARPGTVYHITPPAAAAAPEPEPEQQAIEMPDMPAREEAPWRIAGEVLKTYIICEDGDGAVWLIDKHAAHERVRFDALKASPVPPMEQQLLTPAAVTLSGEEYGAVLENLPLLERCGFRCEDFGDGTVLVRALPDDVPAAEAASTLEEMAQKLLLQRADPETLRDELLHTIACKSAIKAGMTSDVTELAALVRRVQSGEIRYCPHGRPVAARLTRYELEKMFKRA
ncbi:MAG: DNA mismatch repair protein MutL [Firmicutes bacterium CAG:176_63_11]|nr:MAG: DNA mismatch repair protein MutL [Firmicutes bacterium CAG:176_63_11]